MTSRWVLVALLTEKQEYQRAQAEEARAAAARSGLSAQVVFAENDPARQIEQITQACSQPKEGRPLAVVVETAGAVGFERVARLVLQSGVGWVSIAGPAPYLRMLRQEFPGGLVAAVAHDEVEIGRQQGALVKALLPRGGGLLSVEGPSMFVASLQRRRGLEEALAGGRFTFQKTVGADWTVAGAERAVRSWLTLAGKAAARPELVVAQNDEMAVGAVTALRAARPDWRPSPALGVDGLPEGGQRWVREGLLAATIQMAPPSGPAVELVAAAAAGKPAPELVAIPSRTLPAAAGLAPLPG